MQLNVYIGDQLTFYGSLRATTPALGGHRVPAAMTQLCSEIHDEWPTHPGACEWHSCGQRKVCAQKQAVGQLWPVGSSLGTLHR